MLFELPRIDPSGDRAVRVAFGDERSLEVNRPVRVLYRSLREDPLPGVTELVPTYAALTVYYRPQEIHHRRLAEQLRERARRALAEKEKPPAGRLLRVPVCYEGEYGPDMAYVERHTGLNAGEIVARHTAETYFVFQLGFTPGCPFLGPLPEELYVPLMPSPRTSTPTGSVAISVGQTVIYPRATPGGMRVIGRTPVVLFQVDHPDLTLFKPGDRVQLVPVPESRFRELEPACRRLGDGVEVVSHA